MQKINIADSSLNTNTKGPKMFVYLVFYVIFLNNFKSIIKSWIENYLMFKYTYVKWINRIYPYILFIFISQEGKDNFIVGTYKLFLLQFFLLFFLQMEIYCKTLANNIPTYCYTFYYISHMGFGLYNITWVHKTQYSYHSNVLLICRCTNMWTYCYNFKTSRYAWNAILGCSIYKYRFRRFSGLRRLRGCVTVRIFMCYFLYTYCYVYRYLFRYFFILQA